MLTKLPIRDILTGLLLLGVIILAVRMMNRDAQFAEQKALVESLNAEKEQWISDKGEEHSRIQTIQTERPRDFIVINTNDAVVKELQQTVKDFQKYLDKQGSVTLLKSNTDVETKTVTKILPGETVTKDSIVYVFPKYQSSFDLDGWVTGTSLAAKDSTSLSLKIKNEYSVIVGEEKQGLFKKPKPFVEVVNKNPYSSVETIRTYQVKSLRKKRFSVGPQIGYGVTTDLKPQGYIGVGIQYSLFKF